MFCLCICPDRSRRPQLFCKKGVFSHFVKFTGKHLCRNIFFNKFLDWRPETLSKRCCGTEGFLRILGTFVNGWLSPDKPVSLKCFYICGDVHYLWKTSFLVILEAPHIFLPYNFNMTFLHIILSFKILSPNIFVWVNLLDVVWLFSFCWSPDFHIFRSKSTSLILPIRHPRNVFKLVEVFLLLLWGIICLLGIWFE